MRRILNWFKKCAIPHEHNNHKPYFLRIHAVLIVLSIVLFVEIAFLVHVFLILPNIDYLSSILPGVLTDNTNINRDIEGVGYLRVNTLLAKAAQLKANNMAEIGYFDHNSPDGKTPWYWFDKVGYNYEYAGENLAVNFLDSKDVVDAWMNSPGHRENILNGNFTETGIGISKGVYKGRETVFVVQLFGAPSVAFLSSRALSSEEARVKSSVPFSGFELGSDGEEESLIVDSVSNDDMEPDLMNLSKLSTTSSIVAGSEISSSPHYSSFVGRIVTSPRAMANVIYAIIFSIVLLVLMLKIFIKIRIQHPPLIVNGLALLVIIASVLVLNQYLLLSGSQIL